MPRRHLPEVYDAGSAHPFDGRAEAEAAAGKLTKKRRERSQQQHEAWVRLSR